MNFSFYSIFFSKIKFEGNTMDRIQIFDQLDHSTSLQIKHLVWKHFITISIFGLSYKVVCCQNYAFLKRSHTLCEGRNSIKNITIPQLEVDLFAFSLNVTNWSKFWTSPMELLSDSILDKKNDKKKNFIVENTSYIPLKP